MKYERDTSRIELARWVGLAMVVPAIVAVVLLGKDALMMVSRMNSDAITREIADFDRGLTLLKEFSAADVLSQTLREEFQLIDRSSATLDRPAAERLGAHLATDGIDEMLVVGPDSRPLYAGRGREPLASEQTAQLLAAAAKPIQRARNLHRMALRPTSRFAKHLARASAGGLSTTEFALIEGRAALVIVVSLAYTQSETDLPGDPSLLVAALDVTQRLLKRLEALSHVSGLRLVSNVEQAGPQSLTRALTDASGATIAYAAWDYVPAGNAILRAALPAVAGSLGLIALLTALAAITMRRLTRQLAESERAAVFTARYDPLTGLANRGWFMRVFESLLERTAKHDAYYAVLLIDCDHFKTVNDTLGHAAGDKVLASIGQRLRELAGDITVAARLGGDEFVVITAPRPTRREAAAQIDMVAESLSGSIVHEQRVVTISVSIGATLLETPSALSIDAVLAQADMALYRAKNDGRGCWRLYDRASDGMIDASLDTPSPANDRRHAPDHAA